MALFDVIDNDEVKECVARIHMTDADKNRDEYVTAARYVDGDQVDDVIEQLQQRYPRAQSQEPEQRIHPLVVPLAEKYVAEAATVYNHSVDRRIERADGQEEDFTSEQTKRLQNALKRYGWDEAQHRRECMTVALHACGLWPQIKRGKLRAALVMPQDCYPVPPAVEDVQGPFDASDPHDYDGFVVRQNGIELNGGRCLFAFVTAAQVTFFEGTAPNKADTFHTTHRAPYKWQQRHEKLDGEAFDVSEPALLPGQMLSWWHARYPIGSLLPTGVPDILVANRELNIAWSAFWHIMRLQSFSVPYIKQAVAEMAPAQRSYGVLFPIVLGPDDDAGFISAPNDYTGQTQSLQMFVKAFAAAKRMSPADFSLEAQQAASGFAKVLDSLPKIDARDERIVRERAMELETWPALRACLIDLGELDERVASDEYRLAVSYGSVSIPMSVGERTAEQKHEIELNLTTPAEILAKRDGISEDAAIERIKHHQKVMASIGQQTEQLQQPARPGFGSLIARKRGGTVND